MLPRAAWTQRSPDTSVCPGHALRRSEFRQAEPPRDTSRSDIAARNIRRAESQEVGVKSFALLWDQPWLSRAPELRGGLAQLVQERYCRDTKAAMRLQAIGRVANAMRRLSGPRLP